VKRFSILLLPLGFLFSCSKPQLKEKTKKENPLYDKAFEYREHGRIDSAFSYFNQAKDLFLSQRDSLGAAKCLVNMGIISTDKGDNFGGQEISLNALKYLDKTNKNHYPFIHSNYNNLGIATFKLADYQNALKFYDLAIAFAENPLDENLYLNNKAKVYQDTKNYQASLKIYNQILSQNSKNQKEYARALSNLAKTKWLINPNYNAETEFFKALKIREQEKDLWGLNASYAHLADYYIPKKPRLAIDYAKKMYRVATQISSPVDRLQALQKLIKLSSPIATKQYFEIYQKLADSLQTVRNAAKNQFALIRYETEKNKADFLKAKAENIQKQKDILLRNIGIGTLGLCLIFGYFLYQRRQKNLKQEKEIEVKKTELKYVKKIHDRVANRVYQVMSEVENTTKIDKNDLADKLDVIYKISRDLSYDNKDVHNEESFWIELSKMLYAYASAKTNIAIEGGGEKLWEAIKDDTKAEVFCILQELMTNMKKHSEADTVTINFKRANGRITVLYVDNGKGMEVLTPKNGLRNTETRIESISGHITFDTKPDEGLRIEFSFPTL